MSPSVQAFSDTERIVVPKTASMTVVSIYHQQYDCLKAIPLRNLLRRNFLILNLDDTIAKCLKACYRCAATRDEKHIQVPMSSVPPPDTFGQHFATDVIDREKQKILTLRETATSYTWARFIQNETAIELESGLRCLFALASPPNATQLRTCRADNAKSFISLTNNKILTDIGVILDISNPANKNGNPVAEKANREVQNAILGVAPTGGQVSEVQLAKAISALNAKPRWSGMSAVELWTARDMITNQPLRFSQKDIIDKQHKNRAAKHKKPNVHTPVFALGDIVFSNSDRSKLKARDSLIIREDLGNGQYKLDRVCSKSGFTTSTVRPAYDLYAATTTEPEAQPKRKALTWSDDVQTSDDRDGSPPPPKQNNPADSPNRSTAPQTRRTRPRGVR